MSKLANIIISLMLLTVGVIHLLPLAGGTGAEKLQMLYGVAAEDGNLELLLRHRAVLFAILGSYFVYAAFVKSAQITALCFGFVSVVAFLLLAWPVASLNPEITRVFWADIIALICLAIAAVLGIHRKRSEHRRIFG